MATSVSFINMKGGVGKTTMAMQMAMAADHANLKVLAVDLDPQSNLSQAILGVKRYVKHLDANKHTVVQIFEGYSPPSAAVPSPSPVTVEDVILKNVGPYDKSSLDLIPSRLELSQTLRNPTGKERRLAKAIAKVASKYHLIIIDCAPTDSILTDAAYFASRYVVIPIKPEFMATIGLPLIARSLENFKSENEESKIDICGIAFNHSSGYNAGPETRQSVAEVTQFAKSRNWHVYPTHMTYSTSYAKAARQNTAVGLTSYVRFGTAASFGALKDEFFASIGLKV